MGGEEVKEEQMDVSKWALPDSSLLDIGNFQELYDTYKAIEEVYEGSLVAMGYQNAVSRPVSASTNVSFTSASPVSIR
jgi:hypothetical protein